jgi:hypothetical protein
MRRCVQGGLWLLALIGLAARLWTLAHLASDAICGNDFPPLYAGAKLAGTPGLYSPAINQKLMRDAAGCSTEAGLCFMRPPFVAAMMWPFARLRLRPAMLAWGIASLAALVAFLCLWPAPKPVAAVLVCWALPISAAFTQGQDDLFLLLWIGIGAALLASGDPRLTGASGLMPPCQGLRGREFAAGMVLALCAAKFHLFLVFPLFLMGRRLWKTIWGMLAGGAVLAAVSYAAGGLHWPTDFLRVALDSRINPHPWLMPNLHGMLYGARFAAPAEIVLSLAVGALVWYIARSARSLRFALAAALIGGLLTSHHAYLPDASLLLPAALTFPFEASARWVRLLAIAILLPVVYFLTAIPALTWAPPLLILVLLLGAASALPQNEPIALPRMTLRAGVLSV